MIIVERQRTSPEFGPILSLLVDLFEICFVLNQDSFIRHNNVSVYYLTRQLQKLIQKNISPLLEYINLVEFHNQFNVIYFFALFLKCRLLKDLNQEAYQDELLYQSNQSIKTEIQVFFQLSFKLIEVIFLNDLEDLFEKALDLIVILYELNTMEEVSHQILTLLYEFIEKNKFEHFQQIVAFLIDKNKQKNEQIQVVFLEKILEKLMEKETFYVFDTTISLRILFSLKEVQKEEFKGVERLIGWMEKGEREKFNFLAKTAMLFIISNPDYSKIKDLPQILKIFSQRIEQLSLENLCLLECTLKVSFQEERERAQNLLEKQEESNFSFEILLLLTAFSLKNTFKGNILPSFYLKIKEFIYDFGKKIEKNNPDNRRQFWFYRLIRKFVFYHQDSQVPQHSNIKQLLQNFCFNAKDHLDQTPSLQSKFDVNTTSSQYLNKQKFPFIKQIILDTQFFLRYQNEGRVPQLIRTSNFTYH